MERTSLNFFGGILGIGGFLVDFGFKAYGVDGVAYLFVGEVIEFDLHSIGDQIDAALSYARQP